MSAPPRAARLALPWNDRAGRLSWLKLAVFVAVLLPAAGLAYAAMMGQLGVKPVEHAIHETGEWAIRLLLATLAVTPLRRITGWTQFVLVRRMLGLATLGYAAGHFLLFVAQEGFALAHVAAEIVSRIYLVIGFTGLLCLIVLGATSTDAAVRRLRRNWVRLHRLAYVVALLASAHFFLQAKVNISEATLIAGLLMLVFGYRIAAWRKAPLTAPLVLAGVALLAAAATGLIEYAWYALATGLPAERVLAANFTAQDDLRPAWSVAVAGLAVALLPPVLGAVRAASRAIRPRASAAPRARRP
ncbi:MAG: protein-methionine-sulfoxide reductase heme-binding subunit MsrQ [Alphaproteobacteria bacterium]